MPYAISIANDFERQLFVLHVMPPHHTYLIKKERIENDEKERTAHVQLQALTRPGTALKRSAGFLVDFCDLAEGILRTASRIRAGAIIMGTKRDPLADLTNRLSWSVSDRVYREAGCPVLSIGE